MLAVEIDSMMSFVSPCSVPDVLRDRKCQLPPHLVSTSASIFTQDNDRVNSVSNLYHFPVEDADEDSVLGHCFSMT